MPKSVKKEISHVLISLGSNLGDRHLYLERACRAIELCCGKIIAKGPIIETKPIGNANHLFLNTAIICETKQSPTKMLQKLQKIEHSLHRKRYIHWGNRTIDLDIILWQNFYGHSKKISLPHLRVPHPYALLREFVLLPSSKIAGSWQHPLTHRTINAELAALTNLTGSKIDSV